MREVKIRARNPRYLLWLLGERVRVAGMNIGDREMALILLARADWHLGQQGIRYRDE